MSDHSVRERLLSVSPLFLRLGVAAVLAWHGVGQIEGLIAGAADQQLVAGTTGLNLSAAWSTVFGAGELAVAMLLVLGLFTRLATLPVMAGMVLLLVRGSGTATESDLMVIALLGAICLSLFVSGSGYLGLDRRFFRRQPRPESL